MLELGQPATAAAGTGVLSVLHDGAAGAFLRASNWRESLSGGQKIAVSGSTGGWSPRPTLTAEAPLPPAHQAGGS
jgi:hypothetical protein